MSVYYNLCHKKGSKCWKQVEEFCSDYVDHAGTYNGHVCHCWQCLIIFGHFYLFMVVNLLFYSFNYFYHLGIWKLSIFMIWGHFSHFVAISGWTKARIGLSCLLLRKWYANWWRLIRSILTSGSNGEHVWFTFFVSVFGNW